MLFSPCLTQQLYPGGFFALAGERLRRCSGTLALGVSLTSGSLQAWNHCLLTCTSINITNWLTRDQCSAPYLKGTLVMFRRVTGTASVITAPLATNICFFPADCWLGSMYPTSKPLSALSLAGTSAILWPGILIVCSYNTLALLSVWGAWFLLTFSASCVPLADSCHHLGQQ